MVDRCVVMCYFMHHLFDRLTTFFIARASHRLSVSERKDSLWVFLEWTFASEVSTLHITVQLF